MKTLRILVLIALMSAIGNAQSRTMADATYALKGPVRTFRTETATFVLKDGEYVEGPRVLQSQASFNQYGNRTDLQMYNDKGALSRRIVMKFDGRRMTEAINYDGTGKIWLRTVHVYDDEGQTKETITYNGDGTLRSRISLKRNDLGQLIEVTEYSAQGVLLKQHNNKYEGPNLEGYERKLYRFNGTLQSTDVYEAAKKRVETISYKPDGSVAARSIRINQEIAQYGEDGSLQKIAMISGENRLIDEVTLDRNGSTTRQSQLPDERDTYGNWTKQTNWLTDSKGTRPVKVIYRAITYYDK